MRSCRIGEHAPGCLCCSAAMARGCGLTRRMGAALWSCTVHWHPAALPMRRASRMAQDQQPSADSPAAEYPFILLLSDQRHSHGQALNAAAACPQAAATLSSRSDCALGCSPIGPSRLPSALRQSSCARASEPALTSHRGAALSGYRAMNSMQAASSKPALCPSAASVKLSTEPRSIRGTSMRSTHAFAPSTSYYAS